jgi:hypothetical protein
VVVDRRVSPAWDRVARITFDPSGDHVGYVARNAAHSRVVIDGWAGPAHPTVGELVLGGPRVATPEWSPPVRSAYAATADDGRTRVVADGVTGPAFDEVRTLTLLEPSGAAYVARRADREAFARDGQVGAWHERVLSLACSADGRCGYAADDEDGSVVVVDGRTAARAPWASDVALGAGGRWAAVIGQRDGAVVVDEKGRHAFDLVLAGTLQYVADGSRWACLAGDRRRQDLFLVVDGALLDRLDWSTITRETGRGGDPGLIREWVAARAAALSDPGGSGSCPPSTSASARRRARPRSRPASRLPARRRSPRRRGLFRRGT